MKATSMEDAVAMNGSLTTERYALAPPTGGEACAGTTVLPATLTSTEGAVPLQQLRAFSKKRIW